MGCGKSTEKVTEVAIVSTAKHPHSSVSTFSSAVHKDDPAPAKAGNSAESPLTSRPGRLSDLATLYRTPEEEAVLRLEYVYGYNAHSSCCNLFYASSSELIVFPAASVCVLLSPASNTQRFLGGGEVRTAKGHIGEISAVAVSHAKDLVATGETTELPVICVWALSGMELLLTIEGIKSSKGTEMLAFSRDSRLLAAIDLNMEETVSIYEVKSGAELLCASGKPGNIHSLAWNPKNTELWTAGQDHFSIWTNSNGRNYLRSDKNSSETVSVLQFRQDGTAVVGGNEGKLLHLSAAAELIAAYPLHSAAVSITALFVGSEEVLVGLSDCKVAVLDVNFLQLRLIDAPGIPFSLDNSKRGILCGTRAGAIVEFGRSSRRVLMDVHAAGEVAAVAFDKLQGDCVLSSGGDNKLKCWDVSQRRCSSTTLMETNQKPSQTLALDISPNGQVAIGYNDGHFTVRINKFQLNYIVAMGRNNASAISLLKYSPDGGILALGTQAGMVILYAANGKYPVLRELKGHKGRITALDWSRDGTSIRSQDLLMLETAWKVENGEVIPMDKQQDWVTDSRILTTGAETGSLVRAKSPVSDLSIQGSLNGLLELHSPQATPLAYKAHSSLLRSAAWSSDGQTLVTAGGEDLCLFQWKVTAQSRD